MRNRLLNASSPLVLFGRFATAEKHDINLVCKLHACDKYSILRMYVQRFSPMRLNQLGTLIIANYRETRKTAFTLGPYIDNKPLDWRWNPITATKRQLLRREEVQSTSMMPKCRIARLSLRKRRFLLSEPMM